MIIAEKTAGTPVPSYPQSIRHQLITLLVSLLVLFGACGSYANEHAAKSGTAGERWPVERANRWYEQRDWPVGFNYIPRDAINQLEMWQADTFNPEMIDEELGWAADIGFNLIRVYLHDLPWQDDPENYLARIEQFLDIADSHNIDVMLVLFDDVWDPLPQAGKQPEPRPAVHNSGWLQSPGAKILGDLSRHDELEPYVKGVMTRFANDSRVALWDLYNEPGNLNTLSYGSDEVDDKQEYTLALLTKVFLWAREVNPSQPLTAGVWRIDDGRWLGAEEGDDGAALFDFMLANSDIITFHSYIEAADTATAIKVLEAHERPLICSEYMARGHDSTFEGLLPLFADKNIGAIHWGFVDGKTQTKYPWRSWIGLIRFWDGLFSDEPNPWHHDLLRADGSAYRDSEVQFIRETIQEKNSR